METNNLDDVPATKAFVEKMVEEKGRHHFEAVRAYLQMREKVGRMEEGEERTAAIESAANTMALMTMVTGLKAEQIVADGEELARIGISEIQSIRKASFDGPATLQ